MVTPLRICKSQSCYRIPAKGKGYCHACRKAQWRQAYPIKAAFNALRDHAKGRRIPFEITYEQFHSICTATGYADLKGTASDSLTIDRMDNKRGYAIGNVRVLTRVENCSKGAYERDGRWDCELDAPAVDDLDRLAEVFSDYTDCEIPF